MKKRYVIRYDRTLRCWAIWDRKHQWIDESGYSKERAQTMAAFKNWHGGYTR